MLRSWQYIDVTLQNHSSRSLLWLKVYWHTRDSNRPHVLWFQKNPKQYSTIILPERERKNFFSFLYFISGITCHSLSFEHLSNFTSWDNYTIHFLIVNWSLNFRFDCKYSLGNKFNFTFWIDWNFYFLIYRLLWCCDSSSNNNLLFKTIF